jgi:succinate dehydrogenase/fumarate reductase flavoprotein subunit
MALNRIADKVVETDVLVMGGGVGGCPAAAKAAEKGLSVTLVEKAKTDRSGHAGAGIDTVMNFPREGVTLQEYVKLEQKRQCFLNGEGRFADPNIGYRLIASAWWSMEEMEKLGLPMRWDDGKYHWIRNLLFEGAETQLGVHWLDVKPKMAAAVRKRGVNVLERTMVVDLLTNRGKVVGATAVDTRTGEFIVIKAKAVIIAAGPFARSYEPETPQFYKYKFRYHGAPGAISGDGLAAGCRAGAELANMDIGNCWDFRLRDDIIMPFGTVAHGDGIPGRWHTWTAEIPHPTARIYEEVERRGLDPIYMSIKHFPEDYQKRAEIAIADERLISLKIAEDRGFDPKTHRYELMVNKPHNFTTIAGLSADEYFRTSLKGLYVVGDACSGLASCGPAIMSGLLTADNMPGYVSEAGEPIVDEVQVESQKKTALAPFSVKDGTEPMELECAIRYICERYVGMFKSEGKLREGLRRLSSLRRVFLPKLMAKNPHYLMRCLEVRNIMDLTELHLQACLERKESRGNYIRMDYPERDPSRDNMLTFQRIEKGKAVLEIREAPDLKPEYLKPEYAKEGK